MKNSTLKKILTILFIFINSLAFAGGGELITEKSVDPNVKVLIHKSYNLGYDEVFKTTIWSSYILTAKKVNVLEIKRTNDFKKDPLEKNGPSPQDYKGTGYDQGHLANAQDMRFDSVSEHECFYMTNMVPQRPGYNRGIWGKLEDQCRYWSKTTYDSLIIISGPLFLDKNIKYIGNKIPVPSHCYKIVYSPIKKKAIAFIIENASSDKSIFEYVTTIDKIEELTKTDMLSFLEDGLENAIESKTDIWPAK
jgi:endonuclease G